MRDNDNEAFDAYADEIEIQAARLAYIGASIVIIGDGVSAIAASLALRLLEMQRAQLAQSTKSAQSTQSSSSQTRYHAAFNPNEIREQMNYFISELIKVKNTI